MTKSLLNTEWFVRLAEFSKLIVGFSGGLDSTVLLHALAAQPSLHHKIIAVHINHGISANAASWEGHCAKFCLKHDIEFIAQSVTFDRSSNIESNARQARYQSFSAVLQANDCLLLGHHLNDQAETVLLQLFRGSGIDGMGAMKESSYLGKNPVFRPLLSMKRDQLERYAVQEKLSWIEDESNQDVSYSRNFLRHQIIPLLENQWPGVVANIARSAQHAQQAKLNLDDLALMDCPELSSTSKILSIEPLKALGYERVINVLRRFLKQNNLKLPPTSTLKRLVLEVIQARTDASPIVAWGQVQIRRYQDHLYLIHPLTAAQNQDLRKAPEFIVSPDNTSLHWIDFPKPVVFQDVSYSAFEAEHGLIIPQQAQIQIQFRSGGESFRWHGQTKSLKKLFQEWGIPPWLRDRIPLLYINNQLAQVIGYAISDVFYSREQKGWHIKQINRVRAPK